MPGFELSAVASLFADPSRAAMLEALMDADEHPAGELASVARIRPQTASVHLAKLAEGGLVKVAVVGRERRFRLADARVAAAFEALMALAPDAAPRGLREVSARETLRRARTCYDHLAGRLGVELTGALRREGCLAGSELRLTRRGAAAMQDIDIDVEALRGLRRPLTSSCLDGTERTPHLAGALGAALAGSLLERRWIERRQGTRALRITPRGERELTTRGWLQSSSE